MGRRRKCCCNDTCIIYSSDLSSVTGFAQTPSSSFSASSGYVSTATSSAKAIADTVHPDTPFPPVVQAKVRGDAAGVKLRLLLSWNDAANTGLIAELEIDDTCSTLRLIQYDTTETIKTTESVPGDSIDVWHTLRACYDPTTKVFRAWVVTGESDTPTYYAAVTLTSHTDGDEAGFGTGASMPGGSTADFDDFRFFDKGGGDYYDPSCEPCEPEYCWWAVAHFDDADNFTCEWDEYISSGAWTIDTVNGWLDTSTTTSTLLFKSPYWGDDSIHHLWVRFYIADDDRKVRFIVGAADEDNYTAFDVTAGYGNDDQCGRLVVVDRDTGAETEITSEAIFHPMPSGAWYHARIDLDAGNGYCHLVLFKDNAGNQGDWIGQLETLDGVATYYGDYVGFGVQSGTGEVRVSKFIGDCVYVDVPCAQTQLDVSYWPATGERCDLERISGTAGDDFDFDAGVLYFHRQEVPTDHNAHTISGGFLANSDGDVFGVTSGDSTNYYLAELTARDGGVTSTKGVFRLYRVNSGVPTQLASVTLDNAYTMPRSYGINLCIQEDSDGDIQVIGNLTIGSSSEEQAITDNNLPDYGNRGGFTVSPSGGEITLTGFSIIKDDTTQYVGATYSVVQCSRCWTECIECIDAKIPASALLTFALEDGLCDCSTAQRSYVVNTGLAPATVTANDCQGHADFFFDEGDECFQCNQSNYNSSCDIVVKLSGQVRVSFLLADGVITAYITLGVIMEQAYSPSTIYCNNRAINFKFEKDLGVDPLDCENLGQVTLDFVEATQGIMTGPIDPRTPGCFGISGCDPLLALADMLPCKDAGQPAYPLVCGVDGGVTTGLYHAVTTNSTVTFEFL